jgi:phosphatidylglycerophosphate synthase
MWPRAATLPVAAGVSAVSVAAALVAIALPLDTGFVVRAAILALGGGLAVLALAARHLGAAAFGAANAVTLARGALTLLLAASLGEQPTASLAWLVVVFAVVAVALDGVDGKLARSRGETSAFGARFDMETDALLILVLAALVWQHEKAGVWILLAGLLRYLFVLASYGMPWLAEPLPPSKRRQAVCVVQVVSLIGAVAPIVPPPWSATVAAAGLVALVWSFGIDVISLARRARG